MEKHYLIILGGNSLKNKHWVQNMSKNLKLDYPSVEFYYSHWKENLQDINFEKELKRLAKSIKENNITNYSIVAKSAGFVLSLKGVTNNTLSPRTIVGYGLPVEYSNYRKIDLNYLIKASSEKANIICIQADEDPQGDLGLVKKIILDTIPIWNIKDNSHNYDNFKQMTNIAKAFIATHQPQIEHSIKKIDASSLSESIKIVSRSPTKFKFKNNWLLDIENKIYIFSYKNKNFILKHGNLNKIAKEVENAARASSLINKLKIGKKKLTAVVPDVYKINSKNGYLVSEYFGPDCNELFYQRRDRVFSADTVTKIIKNLNKLSIQYKDFIPRNTIVRDNKIYLIDWEKVISGYNSMDKDLQYKTSVIVGWRSINFMTEMEFESVFKFQVGYEQVIKYLNQYEETFKKMLGLKMANVQDNLQIQKLCYGNIIKATDYTNKFSLLKIDDVLHFLSGIIPIEVELLVDFILSEDYEKESYCLYSRLSNIIKIARVKSFMNVDKSKIKSFIREQIKELLLQKLTSRYTNLKTAESLTLLIQSRLREFKPEGNFLRKVETFLNS